jgi:hypothetical protein
LIGSPDHGTPDKKGKPSKLIVKSLLQPQIVCGGRIEVQSAAVKGQFRVEKLGTLRRLDGKAMAHQDRGANRMTPRNPNPRRT